MTTRRSGDRLPSNGPLLAIDIGERRIGVAMSDPHQRVAHPLTTLTRRAGKRFPLRALRTHLETERPVGILVGLPLTLEGDEGEMAEEARRIGTLIGDKSNLPVTYLDERFTTARAHSAIRDLGGHTKGRKADVDQLAATVLLQQYLDRVVP